MGYRRIPEAVETKDLTQCLEQSEGSEGNGGNYNSNVVIALRNPLSLPQL